MQRNFSGARSTAIPVWNFSFVRARSAIPDILILKRMRLECCMSVSLLMGRAECPHRLLPRNIPGGFLQTRASTGAGEAGASGLPFRMILSEAEYRNLMKSVRSILRGIFTNAAIARNIPIMRYGIRSIRTLLRNPIFTWQNILEQLK